MWLRFRGWLNAIRLSDPLQQRQALMLQIMLLVIIVACLLGLPLSLLTASNAALLPLTAYPLLLVVSAISMSFLRRGDLAASVYTVTVGTALAIGFSLLAIGFEHSETVLVAFAVPVTLAGLIVGRRGVLLAGALSIGIVLLTALLSAVAPSLVGFVKPTSVSSGAIATSFILIIGVVGMFLDLFGSSLRDALSDTQARERDLERLRESLEDTVRERTASLEQALQAGEQREAHLSQILEELHTSEQTVRELSAPVLPVLPGVLVAPLIGTLEHARAEVLTNNVLSRVEQTNARYVILDITGVPLVDTQVAHVLLQTAAAVRLLGAQVLIVGIRPEVAQTVVALGVDVGTIATYPDLQEAIAALLSEGARFGHSRVKG